MTSFRTFLCFFGLLGGILCLPSISWGAEKTGNNVWGWEIRLHGYGDNRERIPVKKSYAPSFTRFGANNSALLHWQQDSTYFLRFGVQHKLHFGAPINEETPFLLGWFSYIGDKVEFRLGSMPFYGLNHLPPALLEETHFLYPVLKGMHVRFRTQKLLAEMWIDWIGRQSFVRRETFQVGLSAIWSQKNIFAELHGTLYHWAGTSGNDKVNLEESAGVIALIGFQSPQVKDKINFHVGTGVFIPVFRIRDSKNILHKRLYSYSKAQVTWKSIGLKNILSIGSEEGVLQHRGRWVFQAEVYDRLSPFIQLFHLRRKGFLLDATFQWDVEFINSGIGHTQLLTLACHLGGNFHRSKD